MIPIAWQEVCRLACGGCGGERNDSLFLDGRGVWRRPALEERLKLAEGFLDHVERRGAFLDGFSHFPIQAFDLICRRDASMARRLPGLMIQACRDRSTRLYQSCV